MYIYIYIHIFFFFFFFLYNLTESKKLYWEDSYLEELPFDGDIERWLVVAFDAVSILGALFCMISNLKNIVPAMIIVSYKQTNKQHSFIIYLVYCN